MSLRPKNITADRQTGIFTIVWNDNHESLYPFGLLRYACPCAECRGGHENMGVTPNPEDYVEELEEAPSTRIRNIEAVGTYAITIEWEDGHHFGIYQWGYLKALCPCPICRAEAKRDSAHR